MSKKAIYYEDAKRLYCNEGFSLDTICELLKGNVSRKTLYNWKTDHNWDEVRKKIQDSNEKIEVDLVEIVKKAIKEYNADPTAHNMFAVHKAITSLKMWQGVKAMEDDGSDDSDKPKGIRKETIDQIQRELGIL